ncbi:hypothetical protein N9N55_07965, partial [Opitutales bacterium]|nr:hypothetical protein [Opitutales bacterium]
LGAKGDSHTVQIKKKGAASDITVNLNWKTSADLDLGCFYELNNGRKTVIDGLQFSKGRGGPKNVVSRQGCYTLPPYIWHMGDDTTGSQMSDGEFILINPEGYSHIKRMTIYAYIYEGVANWSQTDAKIVVKVPGNPEIVVDMNKEAKSQGGFLSKIAGKDSSPNERYCAIAGLDFVGQDSIRVTKYVTFQKGHRDLDQAYSWGLNWQAGAGK